MAVKSKKKAESHTGTEYLENPELLRDQLTKTEQFLEDHRGVVIGVAALIAVVIAGFFGWKYYQDSRNEEAQNMMFQAIHYFESDSLDLALDGDGSNLGFSAIVQEYSGTEAANLANYYAGVSYLKKGQYKPAQLFLEDFSSSDLLVQSKAYSLLGDIQMEQGNFDEALTYYKRAANHQPTSEFSPVYWMQAAIAAEKAGNETEAAGAYEKIINDYPNSDQVNEAKKYLAKIQGVS
ncbi:tetratricopeptide repeat protein [Fulvivirga sedimenti]|uniref:Tetratricopeptide repeat protein n=1 Tax=Fulvivirga sedimenti TaxID=2879465 RepID=A0A9X1HUV2_9BACT|nr:tetratricopeptide repeat protein [Fulvivirga sedimenti]MCA6078101.1 tetratricopeptide repeat protein [Fulvivirga sedimenti]